MGLQVWMPLTGNLKNQGLAIITQTSGTAVYKTAGKIGQGLDLSSRLAFNCSVLAGCKQFSVAFWVKLEDDANITGNWQDIVDLADQTADNSSIGTFRAETCYTTGNNYYGVHWHDNQLNAICNIPTNLAHYSGTSNRGIWKHCVMTCNTESFIKIYCDGVFKLENTVNMNGGHLTGAFRLGNNGNIVGCLNDLRIYDHILSEHEIKKISQGLVLHLPLSRKGFGNDNIIKNSQLFNNYDTWIRGGTPLSNEFTTKDGFQCLHITGELKKYVTFTPYYTINNTRYLGVQQNGNTYTLSMDVLFDNVVTGTTNYYVTFYKSGETIDGTWRNPSVISNSGHCSSSTNDNLQPAKLNGKGWQRVYITIRFGDYAWANANYVFQLYFRDFTGDIYVKNAKVEIGEHNTFWTPNSADTIYSILPIAGTTEYDISGYQHNATYNNITYSADTPINSMCTHFGATNAKVHISGLNVSGFNNSYSFAWWGKRDSNSPMFWGFSDGCRLNGMYLGHLWNTGDGANNPLYVPGTTTQVTDPTLNVWHHYVMTGDGTKCRVYMDGVLWAEAKTYKSINGTTIYLNGWNSSTSYSSNNTDIADFRIYATALSADDILDLYEKR